MFGTWIAANKILVSNSDRKTRTRGPSNNSPSAEEDFAPENVTHTKKGIFIDVIRKAQTYSS